ncbi:MAG: IS110 family transposase [Coriobacteriales bacterium]|jgi:transposase|nr:IS110 family transposase [Coriobacteriales bacterium]
MQDYEVTVGLDVGKSFHHMYALDKSGAVVANRRVAQHEQELAEAFAALQGCGSVLVVVDQPNNIGALPIAVARRAGCDVAYLPGLAMRRAAGILPGDAKTDERDAFVICMTARSMPQSLRALPAESELRAGLLALSSYDEDCRCDLTREVNRLRAHLVECCPPFERALGEGAPGPFVLRMLEKYGGPWGMRKAGKAAVRRWAAKEKRVPAKAFERLLDAAWEMACAPDGAALREQFAIPACAARIAELARARKAAEAEIRSLLAGDPSFIVLTSLTGVGVKTAAALVVHVDIARFPDVDHLASYAGIAPRTRQSGTSVKGESAPRAGNKALKSALFLSAFASLRADPLSREYYDRKRAEGKKHNAALICLARRRLKVMYAMMRDLKPYRAAA